MPYILNKTNGAVLTTIEDASLDSTTNLTFVGRNYSGYGETVNENFLRLLENFSNTTAPSRPIVGQLWFDNTDGEQCLKLCYNGKDFKRLAPLVIKTSVPTGQNTGDLWWNPNKSELSIYNGFKNIVVNQTTSGKSIWTASDEIDKGGTLEYSILRAETNGVPFITVARLTNDINFLTPEDSSDLAVSFSNGVRKGITLPGCDINGSSKENNFYFWGTASEALKAVSTTYSTSVVVKNQTGLSRGHLTFIGTDLTDGSKELYVNSELYYDFQNHVLSVTSASSRYADLAEKYESDDFYDIGTVLVIGGEKEVTVTNIKANTAVIGVVSKEPAFKMNAGAGSDITHPYIALKGRIPCKVAGTINKGDLLVTSSVPGYASAFMEGDSPNAVFAKALGSNYSNFGIIEVLVV